MDVGLWSQLLLNTQAICVRPGIQLITPYVTSSDTNSSVGSEENGDGDEGQDNEGREQVSQPSAEDNEQKDDKKSIQRVRYSKEEYHCPQCPYTCTTEKAFLRHLRHCGDTEVESDCRPVSCPVCGKDRRDEELLSFHMMKHKQDKHFCCDICKFKSLQLKKLIQHRRMHTGEKPHLCPFCSYRSSRRDNLRSHVRRVHKKNDLPCDTFTPRSMILSPRKLDIN